ncbi:MAG: hypothetical protein AB7O77_16750, partial [Phycisphaerales bacterium]
MADENDDDVQDDPPRGVMGTWSWAKSTRAGACLGAVFGIASGLPLSLLSIRLDDRAGGLERKRRADGATDRGSCTIGVFVHHLRTAKDADRSKAAIGGTPPL